jgi:hypothetical protein
MKTIEICRTELKLSAPKTVTTKREMKWSKTPETACTIPAGTELAVYFSEARPSRIWFDYAGSLRTALLVNAHKNFTGGFTKPPGMKTLEKYSWNGIAKTVLGNSTEPDGYGFSGEPSWLLVLGVI